MSLSKQDQQRLLLLAKESITTGLLTGHPLKINSADYSPALLEKRATFVTLQKNKQLRGCIGCLEAIRPLAEDIAENAYAAAFKDSRFPALSPDELDALEIHLSLLTPAVALTFNSEADLLSQLKPGIDGLILEAGYHRGTFLPSVWESLPKPKQFLRHLKQKAGLAPDYWSDQIKVARYSTESIS